jgi:hypothetical protein
MSIEINVPQALANELAAEGLAETQPTARSAGWELLWETASGASIIISLMQAPEIIKRFTEICFRRLKEDQSENEQRLEAKGPGGQMRIIVRPETDLREVGGFLRKTLFIEIDDDAKEK